MGAIEKRQGEVLLRQRTKAKTGWDAVREKLAPEMEMINRSLEELWLTRYPWLANPYPLAKGKRLRPILVLLGASFGQKEGEVVTLATGTEALHLATLIHDDILDRAPTRRGEPSIHARWGTDTAILLGDYFYGKSLSLMARCGSEVVRIMAEVIADLVDGELMQRANRFNPEIREKDYLYLVEKKAASFLSACCRVGALVTEASPEVILSLRAYGHQLGMAFQLQDDLLDLEGARASLGKPVGQDMILGLYTLPLIRALTVSPRAPEIKELLARQPLGTEEKDFILQEVKETGALEYSKQMVRRFIRRAKSHLKGLPDLPAKKSLEQIADFVAGRSY